MTLSRTIFALALSLLIGACGFHLRGAQPLPFQSIYLSVSAYSEAGAQLRRQIAANGTTRIVDKPEDAEVKLLIVGDAKEKVILSLDTKGRVREYELRQKIVFKVVDRGGREVIPATELNTKREMTFNDAQVLAKEQEEAQIYREMENDLVQRVLRRMSVAQWPLPDAPATQSAPAR
ncbi:LPS assembly lipoprotein LptE [Niveibacterium sp. 24ML]|uniref:LPS-assembly lipoprotein LptE n=1 Tax=Niveibacterium sp. 24ML TaxID=2985512 RepID=UPI002270BB4B|nr:LPS assembly lipoprotein LptE [Niveibacterium sp. 24ML]MCX9155841.1 LPS assembly lipoprotein LptE [Niveibacterium sp. 24ML]